ncbi:MAG: CRISPR-associated endonuclease Cas1 [Bacteroidales bacterium]|nr:CRISPR-associated endonuclease Cas1 [Bacteroidales bacterium]MDD2323556.1 CRISPR-associated endonuclease Cas1 [Bacteroidales bacterium]MDY0284891.1 CRISPR-associated endonuclease Cas1 [Bacteroidales bacterium]
MLLAVTKYGAALKVKEGSFYVLHKDGTRIIPVEKTDAISLHTGISVTIDALELAINNGIEVMLTDRRGNPIGRIWSNRFGSISTIRKNQVLFCKSVWALRWIKNILSQKLENQAALLMSIAAITHDKTLLIDRTLHEIKKLNQKIKNVSGETLAGLEGKLRGYEGKASLVYWQCINTFLPEPYKFKLRSQHPARDIFNAMLNYAYGMLYSVVEGKLIEAGIDPYLGVLHRDNYNRPVLVYDFIERYRVWADYVVCHLCFQYAMHPDYFEYDNGEVLVANEGKHILIQSMRDYLDEVGPYQGIMRSREIQILLYAQNFATNLKEFPSIQPNSFDL